MKSSIFLILSIVLALSCGLWVLGAQQFNAYYLMSQMNEAIQASPTDSAVYRERARLWVNKQQLEPALEDLQKAHTLSPKDAGVLYDLGWIYSLQGHWAAAEKHWNQALALQPRDHDTQINLIWLYLKTERMTKAQNQFDILKNETVDPQKLGRIQCELGQFEGGLENLAKMEPGYLRSYAQAECYLLQRKSEQALAKAKEALDLTPHSDIYHLLAKIYLQNQQLNLAMTQIKRALQLQEHPAYYLTQADIYYRQNQTETALALLKTQAERTQAPRLFLAWANLLKQAGQLEAAQAVLGECLKQTPWFLPAQLLNGQLAYQQGEKKAAYAALMVAQKHYPQHPASYISLARFRLADNQTQAARAHLKQALLLEPGLRERLVQDIQLRDQLPVPQS